MSFVAAVTNTHKRDLLFMSPVLSQALQTAYADAINAINTSLNHGSPSGHRTLNIISTLNDRVEKDIGLARLNGGFPDADTLVDHGMLRMRYVPKDQQGELELLYRVMLLGALTKYTADHPLYRDTARTQTQAYEQGIAQAYSAVHEGDTKGGEAFAKAVCEEIQQGRGR